MECVSADTKLSAWSLDVASNESKTLLQILLINFQAIFVFLSLLN